MELSWRGAGTGDEKPLASFIIGNYNGEEILPECIESILRQTVQEFEVIVVDDASRDNSVKLVKERYPQVKVLENPGNRGLPYSLNRGFEASTGRFVAFLNNDVALREDWLERMLEAAKRWQDARLFASHLLFYDHPRIINSTGGILNLAGYAWDRSIYLPDDRVADPPRTFYPCGAAMLAHRSLVEEAGPFDELYGGYYEDVELGWRTHLLGYEVIYVREAVAYHRFSFSMGRSSPRKLYLSERNRMRTMIKNFQKETLRDLRGELLHLYLRRIREVWELQGLRFKARLAYLGRLLQAPLWNLFHLGSTLRERRRVERLRKVTDLQLVDKGLILNRVTFPRVAESLLVPDYRPVSARDIRGRKRAIRMREEDGAFLGEGWHNLQRTSQGIEYRWTGEEATAFLSARKEPRRLVMEILQAHPGEGSRLRVVVNGREVGEALVEKTPARLYFGLPGGIGNLLEVRIVVENPFRPEKEFAPGERVLLGVAVSRIKVGR